MGFFKSSRPVEPAPVVVPDDEPVVQEKQGLFGREKTISKRHSTVAPAATTSTPTSPVLADGSTAGSSHLNRLNEIKSNLPGAREKVRLAEVAETNARQALRLAEAAVIEARRHVKALEVEAHEQAKLAELAAREANAKLAEVTALKKKTGKMGRIQT